MQMNTDKTSSLTHHMWNLCAQDPATAAAACLVAAPATDGRPGFDNRRRLETMPWKPVETWDIHPRKR